MRMCLSEGNIEEIRICGSVKIGWHGWWAWMEERTKEWKFVGMCRWIWVKGTLKELGFVSLLELFGNANVSEWREHWRNQDFWVCQSRLSLPVDMRVGDNEVWKFVSLSKFVGMCRWIWVKGILKESGFVSVWELVGSGSADESEWREHWRNQDFWVWQKWLVVRMVWVKGTLKGSEFVSLSK